MPITDKHPDFLANEDEWDRCENFYEGEKAVKKEGVKYLPKLTGQSESKYEAYKKRAIFYSAAARTVSGLVGAIFRKSPVVSLPPKLEYLRSDATGKGSSLTELAVAITTQIMITGRIGLIVDRNGTGKPYIRTYDADDICNWSDDSNSPFIVLEEEVWERDPSDKFSLKEKETYRELTIEDGEYVVRVWAEMGSDKEKEWKVVNTIKPLKAGRPMTVIPFTCVTPSGLGLEVDRPPISDLVNIMEKHYQISADYANALHVTSLPTPYVAADIKNEKGEVVFALGTDTAWLLPKDSKAGFIEYTGQGLNPIEKALDKLENMLAALGARLIETRKVASVAETAEGIRTKEAAALSILSQIVASTEAALEKCLRWAAEWEGADPSQVSVKLNRELVQAPIDANMLTAMVKAVQGGTISFDTFYHNLEEAGMTDPGIDSEAEKVRIKNTLADLPKKESDKPAPVTA